MLASAASSAAAAAAVAFAAVAAAFRVDVGVPLTCALPLPSPLHLLSATLPAQLALVSAADAEPELLALPESADTRNRRILVFRGIDGPVHERHLEFRQTDRLHLMSRADWPDCCSPRFRLFPRFLLLLPLFLPLDAFS